ncbi:MAG: CoA transferase [Deltaproteobacteria bacterium]|nr:CoA transferase [Deltaproteobacteria bacterium]
MTTLGPPPLTGTRVLDLSSGIAGPYCTKLLADAGAEVIKVESPSGDHLRRWSATGADLGDEDGAFFRFLNTSKRSVVLSLASAAGREALLDLAVSADLVVEDLRPGKLDAMGLGHAALSERNPALSLASITPFGGGGPWSQRAANEFTLQAWAGSTHTRGLPNEEPVSVSGWLGEFVAGAFGAPAALAAIETARRSGRGKHVDVSIFETMLLSFQQYRFIFERFEPGFPSNREIDIPSIEPAKDGMVGFAVVTGQQWQDFCLLIDQPEFAQVEESQSVQNRFAKREEVWEMIRSYTRERSMAELLERAEMLRVPAAPVVEGARVPALDHFKARGVYVENPAGFQQPRVPYRLERCMSRPFEPAPALGADSAAILAERHEREPAIVAGGDAEVAPLRGLRVLDLSAFWAGPVVGNSLSALGADVIKIESTRRPDMMRFSSGFVRDTLWEWSPIYHGANPNKRCITLDLTTDAGRDILGRLAKDADIVIENFSARVLDNLGIGWEWLHAINPKAILMRLPAFGLDGPWRDRTGFAMTIEQVSGLAWRTGHPDGPPLIPRGPCDPIAGAHGLFTIQLALRDRERTGEGQLIEVPLVEVGLNAAAEQVIEFTAYGGRIGRQGNRGRNAAPQGIYRALGDDAWVAISVETDAQWEGLVRALGDPAWARAAELASAPGRLAAHDLLDEKLSRAIAELERDVAVERLLAADVPAAPIISPNSTGENPQARERGFFQEIEHPLTGKTPYPSFPARFDGSFIHWQKPAPTLGQHNDEVLSELLGLTEQELAELRASGVIGERPAFV